jgi:hypothetical protein
MRAGPALPTDPAVACQLDEIARDLRRRSPTAPLNATRVIDRLGVVAALVALGDADSRVAPKLRLAAAATWSRNPWQRRRFIAAARGDRWAAIEILGEISESLPRRPGQYGPEVISMRRQSPAPIRAERRARPRGRRDRRASPRSTRAGPDDADGEPEPPGSPVEPASGAR